MTTLLQRAFAVAEKLPTAEQDLLVSRLLAELAAEDAFDRDIARSSDKLALSVNRLQQTPPRQLKPKPSRCSNRS